MRWRQLYFIANWFIDFNINFYKYCDVCDRTECFCPILPQNFGEISDGVVHFFHMLRRLVSFHSVIIVTQWRHKPHKICWPKLRGYIIASHYTLPEHCCSMLYTHKLILHCSNQIFSAKLTCTISHQKVITSFMSLLMTEIETSTRTSTKMMTCQAYMDLVAWSIYTLHTEANITW